MTDPQTVFAIPLKPRSMAHDWAATETNLRRTLASVSAAARGRRVAVCVACHDAPDLHGVGDVTVLTVAFDPPASLEHGSRDKSRKRRHIAAWARDTFAGDVRVVFVDADDLVHRQFLDAVEASPARSQIVTDGYFVDAAAGVLTRRRGGFFRSCGTSFASVFAHDELPTGWDDLDAPFSQFGSTPEHRGHQLYDEVAAEQGRPAAPLGIPGVAYLVNHSESMWRAKGRGSRRLEYPTELVWPAAAARTLRDDFAAPDLAASLSGPARTFALYGQAVVRRARRAPRRASGANPATLMRRFAPPRSEQGTSAERRRSTTDIAE